MSNLENRLINEAKAAIEELYKLNERLLRIRSCMEMIAQAKTYFDANSEYLRKLYNGKSDEDIMYTIANSLVDKEKNN